MRKTPPLYPTAADLRPVIARYEDGLYLQAHRAAQAIGPLSSWRSRDGLLWAGRLTVNLGGARRGAAFFRLARRLYPDDTAACAYYGSCLLDRRGPLAAWEFFHATPLAPKDGDAPEDIQFHLAMQARTLAMLRDFSSAWDLWREAEARDPRQRWIGLERCFLLEHEDRYQEALAGVEEILAENPLYRPALQYAAHLYQLLDRDAEALRILREGSRHLESCGLTAQLAALEMELELYHEALASLDRYESLAPCAEAPMRVWLASSRCLARYHLGDHEGAIALAGQLEEPIFREFAGRLAGRTGREKKVRLDVGFVRQHHLTCAPATLSALGEFFGRRIEHLEVAEAICYDGTPTHRIRAWLEDRGWLVREFTLTWEAATALIDRGVPFAVGTVETEAGHYQAVIGYDELQRSLLIRDPGFYYARGADYEKFLQTYQAWGPRCLLMVPSERADLVAGLTLPDTGLYDMLYRLYQALEVHDRETADEAAHELEVHAPGHTITLIGRTALHIYDANTPAILACLEERLARYPRDGALLLTKLSCLRELGRRAERLALLEEICRGGEAGPVFCREYARELLRDYRRQAEARSWLRRALRRETNPDAIQVYADMFQGERSFAEALSLYRYAACLGTTKEYLFQAYFQASRGLRRTEESLQLLGERAERLRGKSAHPLITLLDAYRNLDRTEEALAVLQRELAREPVHGELLLYAANLFSQHGRGGEADRRLAEAVGRVPRKEWLQVAAEIAVGRGDRRAAIEAWREVLSLEPLAMDAHHALTRLLAETEGIHAALAHLELACAAFPHHYGLRKLRVELLRDEDPAGAIADLRRLLAYHPFDVWAWRELALHLSRAHEHDEAARAAEEALRLSPNDSYSHSVRGTVALRAGMGEAAAGHYRQAVRLSVDNVSAVHGLMESCALLEEKREALAFIESELIRQTVFGDGVLVFRSAATGILAPEELLASLQRAQCERPDLWHSWSVLIDQLLVMDRLEEAENTAKRACAAFPMLPVLWLDLANVARARLDERLELEALTRAHELDPAWGQTARRLAEFHERGGDLQAARGVLERACLAAPLDPYNFGCLADLLWLLGERDEALDRVRHALRLESDYDWAWGALRRWAAEVDRPGLALAAADDLIARRPGDFKPLLIRAEILFGQARKDEALAAVDKALVLAPREYEAHDLKARILAASGRYDEALACCAPSAYAMIPAELRVRRAWLLRQMGETNRALQELRVVVAEQPDLAAAWRALLELCWDCGRHDEADEAVRRLIHLAPNDPVNWGYLGSILQERGARAEAKEAFSRALALDPGYGFAAHSLFALQLADKELAAAERTLAVLSKRAGAEDPEVLSRAVELAAAGRERERAFDLLVRLCGHESADREAINRAAQAAAGRRWRAQAKRIVETAMRRPAAPAATGAAWAELAAAWDDWPDQRTMAGLGVLGASGRAAVTVLIERIGDALQGRQHAFATDRIFLRRLLRRILREHGDWLRKDTSGWGMAGYALLAGGDIRGGAAWMADWRDHPEAEVWMLNNLLCASQRLGRDEEAYEIARWAADSGSQAAVPLTFRLWAAIEEILRGDAAAGANRLRGLEREMIERDRPLFDLAQALLAVDGAAPGAYRFTREDRKCLESFLYCYRGRATARRVFRRAARLCADRARNAWPMLWALWQSCVAIWIPH